MKDQSLCPRSRCHCVCQGEVENSSQLGSAGREPSLNGHHHCSHGDCSEGAPQQKVEPCPRHVGYCHGVSLWGLEATGSTVLSLCVMCDNRGKLIKKNRATGRGFMSNSTSQVPVRAGAG